MTQPGGRLKTGMWRDAGTLRIVREDPVATVALKLLPLHLVGGPGRE